jgi:hypothetical protein
MSFFRLKNGLNAAAGSALVSLDPSSPANSFVKISTTTETRNVLLGIFDVKMKNHDGNLLKIRVNINSSGSSSINSIFSNIKLKIGGSMYSADSVTATTSTICSSAVATFANIGATLPANINVQIMVTGDVAKDFDGRNDRIKVSASIEASGTGGGLNNNPTILDINYENIEVDDSVVTSSDLSLISLPVMVWNETVSKGPFIVPQAGGGSVIVGFGFTLTAFDVPLYMSKDTLTAIGVQAGYGATAELEPTPDMVEPSSAGGDGTTYFMISPGASRTFHFSGKVKVENATTGDPLLRVTAINLGTAPGITSISITNSLERLRIP